MAGVSNTRHAHDDDAASFSLPVQGRHTHARTNTRVYLHTKAVTRTAPRRWPWAPKGGRRWHDEACAGAV